MNKTLVVIIITAVVVGAGAFYGGIKYDQSKTETNFLANFQNRPLTGSGMESRSGTFTNRSGGSFIMGEIISKDDESITLKLQNGGSKIVFYSDNTEVGKFVNGTPNDLDVGQTVMVSGKTNPDGSITSQSIQIRSIR